MKKICLISAGHIVPGSRTDKIHKLCLENGYEVTLINHDNSEEIVGLNFDAVWIDDLIDEHEERRQRAFNAGRMIGKRSRIELNEILMEAIGMKPMKIHGRGYEMPAVSCMPSTVSKSNQHLQGKGTRRVGQRRGSKPWNRR